MSLDFFFSRPLPPTFELIDTDSSSSIGTITAISSCIIYLLFGWNWTVSYWSFSSSNAGIVTAFHVTFFFSRIVFRGVAANIQLWFAHSAQDGLAQCRIGPPDGSNYCWRSDTVGMLESSNDKTQPKSIIPSRGYFGMKIQTNRCQLISSNNNNSKKRHSLSLFFHLFSLSLSVSLAIEKSRRLFTERFCSFF